MRLSLLIAMMLLGGCAAMPDEPRVLNRLQAMHEGSNDDLLTAGLGAEGLRSPTPPAVSEDAQGRRRLAYYSNWRAIADLSPGGGYGSLYGYLGRIPGIEIKAWLGEPGLAYPHGVLLHIPMRFDADRPCIVVAPVSGSRGIYGALATAGAWGLAHGCAVVYTDKGAGTGFFDMDAGIGIALDGEPVPGGALTGFTPEAVPQDGEVRGIAVKHAHSKDHPEAHWGRMTLSAVRFAMMALEERLPGRRFTPANTRVIAASISNGGGAVLRALEQDEDGLIDAVVAAAPQISVAGTPVLLDYALRAALLAPCAVADPALSDAPLAAALGPRVDEIIARCDWLAADDWIEGEDLAARGRSASQRLMELGFPPGALLNNAGNVATDLWRVVAVTYAHSYARAGAEERLCGYGFYALDASDGRPRPATAEERARWFATSSGIPPTAGVALLGPIGEWPDLTRPALECLWYHWRDPQDPLGERMRRGAEQLRASGRIPDRPVVVIHGRDDGVIPVGATSRPWVASALAHGARKLSYWEVEHAQHFDAFLMQPAYAEHFVPLLPYFFDALDQVMAHLDGGPAPAPSQVVRTRLRARGADGQLEPLTRGHLGTLRGDPGSDAIRLGEAGLVVPD